MAAIDYKNVQYDKNTDYQALINAEMAKGAGANKNALDIYNIARAAKIYNDPALTQKYGSTIPTQYQQQQPIPQTQQVQPMPPTALGNNLPTGQPAPQVPQQPIIPQQPIAPIANPEMDAMKAQLLSLQSALDAQSTVKTPTIAPYVSKYDSQLSSLFQTLQDKISNKKTYDPNSDVALQSAQNQVIGETAKQFNRRNLLPSDNAKYQMQQSAMNLIPQFQQNYEQGQQQDLSNIYNQLSAVQAAEGQNFNQYQGLANIGMNQAQFGLDVNKYNTGNQQWNTNRSDSQLSELGKVIDPNTGKVVDTAAQTRQQSQDVIAAQEREKTDWANNISQFANNYQAEINKIQGDNDPTNDWKLAALNVARQQKVETLLKNDLATIGQYGNDYQAEINRRAKIDPNDPLIPYLKIARADKIANIQAAQLSAEEKNMKTAMELWKAQGVASPFVAQMLGVPEGAKTQDYQVALANIAQSNASAAASNRSNRGGSTSSGAKYNATLQGNIQDRINYINKNFGVQPLDVVGDPVGDKTLSFGDKVNIGMYLYNSAQNGEPIEMVNSLANIYGIDSKVNEAVAEAMFGTGSVGYNLPSSSPNSR